MENPHPPRYVRLWWLFPASWRVTEGKRGDIKKSLQGERDRITHR